MDDGEVGRKKEKGARRNREGGRERGRGGGEREKRKSGIDKFNYSCIVLGRWSLLNHKFKRPVDQAVGFEEILHCSWREGYPGPCTCSDVGLSLGECAEISPSRRDVKAHWRLICDDLRWTYCQEYSPTVQILSNVHHWTGTCIKLFLKVIHSY